jgi:hypothetical protein
MMVIAFIINDRRLGLGPITFVPMEIFIRFVLNFFFAFFGNEEHNKNLTKLGIETSIE